MKSTTVVSILSCMLCAWVSGCATPASSVWPGASPHVWLHYQPEPTGSTDEAVGTIRNLQQDFVEWNSGINFASLDVDAYGLRAKWEWTEVNQQTNYVPSYSGFFAGYNYVPIYGGSYQTQTYTTAASDMLVIPFDEVKGLTLLYMPDFDRAYKYGLVVGTSQKEIPLRMADARAQLKLANAIYTLAAARGAEIGSPSVGLHVRELTVEQRESLGLSADMGVLVVNVANDSPAEKAGIQFLDVLLEVNGQSLTTATGVAPLVEAAQQAGEDPISVKLLRRQKVSQPITNKAGKVTGQREVEETVERTVEITV